MIRSTQRLKQLARDFGNGYVYPVEGTKTYRRHLPKGPHEALVPDVSGSMVEEAGSSARRLLRTKVPRRAARGKGRVSRRQAEQRRKAVEKLAEERKARQREEEKKRRMERPAVGNSSVTRNATPQPIPSGSRPQAPEVKYRPSGLWPCGKCRKPGYCRCVTIELETCIVCNKGMQEGTYHEWTFLNLSKCIRGPHCLSEACMSATHAPPRGKKKAGNSAGGSQTQKKAEPATRKGKGKK